MHGAANIIREHNEDLLRTSIGCQLFHLFTRLELSASQHLLLDDQVTMSDGLPCLDDAAIDLQTLRYEDFINGTSEFEFAWTELVKIMIPITALRMIPRTSDRGTQIRKAQGEVIQQKLRNWEGLAVTVFQPAPQPNTIVFLDLEIMKY